MNAGPGSELSLEGKRALLAQRLQARMAGHERRVPLSEGQKALWFVCQDPEAAAAYNTVFAARILSPVNTDAMARAIQALVARHPALRTVFALEAGAPVQVVRAAGVADFKVVEARDRTLEEVRRLASEEARRPFALDVGPLLRVRLFSRTDADHVLVVVLHHLIQDGWSLWLLLDELGLAYQGLAAGGGTDPAEPVATYADFVAWQAERLAGPDGEADWRFWRERLAGDLPQLEATRDSSVEPPPRHVGAAHRFALSPDLRAGLEQLSREQGVTLNATLLAAFGLLLSRWTGQDEILVGALAGGSPRAQARFAEVVGYFVNPVLARLQPAPTTSVSGLLRETHDQLLDAMEHQDYPFSRIVERLQPPRQAGRAPLAQAMFALQRPQRARDLAGLMAPEGDGEAVAFAGLRLAPFDLPVRDTPFELLLDVFVTRDGLACSLRYATRLFSEAAVRSLAEQFRRLLEAMVRSPQQPIGGLTLVGAEERRRLIEVGQGVRLDLPPGGSVEQWLEAAARDRADAPAVIFQGRTVTYADLHRRANGLAHRLRGLGVGPGDIVAVALRRSVEMVTAVLATFKSGGAYLPLDPEAPVERLKLMIADSGATVILTEAELADRFEGSGRVVVIGPDQAADDTDQAPPAPSGEGALAYVIYTSGSTGRPKGVRVVRRTLVNLVAAMRDLLRPGPDDAFLAVTSLAFDVSVVEIFAGLCAGSRLILADRHEVMDGARLRRLIEAYAPRFMQATPSSWQLLLASGWTGDRRLVALSAGEALSTWLGGRLMETCGEVWNLYGPTEATVYATGHRLTALDRDQGGPAGVTIGRPLANMQAYILDPNLEPVPFGTPGELYVGGAGVAEGYLGRPELTAERFIPDPFSTRPQARLYKTGDLAVWRADGAIEFRGRLDEQLKVRGHRIEPGEIEAVLNGHPSVAEAVVVARADSPGDLRLVGYVALLDGAAGETTRDQVHADLRDRLARTLPDYMRPSALIFLDRLPRTTSGKISRRDLPAAPVERPPLASAYVTPRSEIETLIAAVWMEVLNTEQVGINDNFFDLGGHSLLAVTAQTRLGAAIGRPLAPTLLLEHPTIQALAAHLAETGVSLTSPGAAAPQAAAPVDDPAEASDRIAIVGLACRVPGADTLDAFWRNLEAGVESISRLNPAELAAAGVDPAVAADPRFVPASGRLEGIDRFDARLFGYSGRDAALMDPQQRVFLECAWEALEHAGYNGATRPGAVGVFAGSGINAYAAGHVPPADPAQPAAAYQQMLGNEKDYLATRIAYKLDLSGPCMTVQTACSTALAAVHLAAESLRSGACDLALAGGVSLRLPDNPGYIFQDGMILSPDGRCRAFDAQAQGTVPGSGAGVVVLKRLADAQRDGDTIHAVICGSAINNDGARKAGFTAPSLEGQAAVVAAALDRAGLSARSIGYVEAHGTGTPLGDPIEIAALTRAFRASTADTRFCAVGSVKTNLGHLDAAAGVVGLIKAVLAIGRGKIPASLNFQTPNPAIDFANSPFFVNAALRDWSEPLHERFAGVSAFGIGGANVHLVVGGAPPVAAAPAPARPVHVLTLSAADEPALEALADRYQSALAEASEQALADICYTANVGRRRLARRHAIVGASKAELLAGLAAFRAGAAGPAMSAGPKGLQGAAPKLALLFEDVGPPADLARTLYADEPRFRAAVDRCDEIAASNGHRGLAQQVAGAAASPSPEMASAAGFAVGHGLAELWRGWGLAPEAVGGVGGGGLVAGVAAGGVGLEDGLRLALARGGLIAGRLSSGAYAELLRATPVAPLRIRLLEPAGGFTHHLSAETPPGADLRPALRTLAEEGYGVALALARGPIASDGPPVAAVPAQGVEPWRPLLEGLALCDRLGAPVDWAAFDAPHRRRRVPWPTYPFERARHWLPRRSVAAPALGTPSPNDPLLGDRIAAAVLKDGEAIFQATWSAERPAYLGDHQVDGQSVAPLTAYLQAALAAGGRAGMSGPVRVRDLCVEQPLTLDPIPRPVQAVVRRPAGGGVEFSFYNRTPEAGPQDRWLRHASATLEPAVPTDRHADLGVVRARLAAHEADLDVFDAGCRAAGVVYGPRFRNLARLWVGADEALGELTPLAGDLAAEAPDTAHPAWIDSALQVMGALLRGRGPGLRYRPIAVGAAQLARPGEGRVWCHATLHPGPGVPGMVRGDLHLYDADGRELGRLQDVEFRAAQTLAPGVEGVLYDVAWRALPAIGFKAAGLVSAPAVRATAALPPDRALENQRAVAVLEALAATAMASALTALGGDLAADEILGLDPLMSRLGIVERHRPLVRRMLQVLEAAGQAQRIGNGWRLRTEATPGELERRFAEAEAYPDIHHELKLLRRASQHLAGLLQGRDDPLEVLFPRGDLTDATNLYERSLPPTLLNGMVLGVVEQLIAAAPADRPLRILELGAGTGATASRLLEALPPGRFEYMFTDVSTAFVSRARKRFEGRSEVDYRTLDVESSPAAQGFAPQSFDIVIAANVLHTAQNLGQALGHARDLLAPGGVLLAVEANAARAWADVVFGATDGWWRFEATEGDRDHALLSTAAWREHLVSAGFAGVEAVEPGEAFGAGLGHVLLVAQAAPASAGPWIVLAEDPIAGRALISAFERAGARGVLVESGAVFEPSAAGTYRLDLRRGDQLDRLFAPETLGETPAGVIRLWAATGSGDPVAAAQATLEEALSITQALLRRAYPSAPRLALVTWGAQATAPGAGVSGLAQAPLWGLGKTVALEHPELGRRAVDLDPQGDERQFEALVGELLTRPDEPEAALRGGVAYAPRLVTASVERQEPPRLRGDGAYLITGGVRGLGLRAAEWMAGHGARDLILVGRRPPAAEGEAVLARLRDAGVRVRVRTADVAREAEVQALVEELRREGPPLRGVVHAAGVLDDGVLINQSPARFATVMGPKAAGAWHLHRFTADQPIEAFVVFSSIASLFGARAQANHAAANAFVDRLCAVRRAQGLPAVSINWGPWRDIGAAAARDVEARGLNRGVASLDPGIGLEILAAVWNHPTAQVGAASIAWPEFLGPGQAPALFREVDARPAAQAPRPPAPARAAPARSAPAEAGPMIERVSRVVSEVLGVPSDSLDPGQGLFDMGLDSLGAITLRHALQDEMGRPLAATVVFRFPTIEALAAYLLDDPEAAASEAPASPPDPIPPAPASSMSGAAGRADWESWSEAELADALERELADVGAEPAGPPGAARSINPLETSRNA